MAARQGPSIRLPTTPRRRRRARRGATAKRPTAKNINRDQWLGPIDQPNGLRQLASGRPALIRPTIEPGYKSDWLNQTARRRGLRAGVRRRISAFTSSTAVETCAAATGRFAASSSARICSSTCCVFFSSDDILRPYFFVFDTSFAALCVFFCDSTILPPCGNIPP
jgi:hypothetical protein